MKRNKWLYKYSENEVDYNFWMFSRFKNENEADNEFFIQDKKPYNAEEVRDRYTDRVVILKADKNIEAQLKKSKLDKKYKKIVAKYYENKND